MPGAPGPVVARRLRRRALGADAAARRGGGDKHRAVQPIPQGLAGRRTAASLLREVIERRAPLDALLDETHANPHFQALAPRDRGWCAPSSARRSAAAARSRRRLPSGSTGRCRRAPTRSRRSSISPWRRSSSSTCPITRRSISPSRMPRSDRRAGRARGLVNSVLRRWRASARPSWPTATPARINTPDWLFARWRATYGDDIAAGIAAAHRDQPPLDLSARNDPPSSPPSRRSSAADRLRPHRRAASCWRASGYDEGAFWVQDAAAALPARLLGDVAGKRVADLCAAPGGKTAQPRRIRRACHRARHLEEPAEAPRRQSRASRALGRARRCRPARMESGVKTYDAVLLDAPCSATGTIRRHPDIPWLKRPEDIVALAALQAKMLDRAAGLVGAGRAAHFRHLLAGAGRGRAPCRAVPGPPSRIHARADRSETRSPASPTLVTPRGTLRTLPSSSFGPEPAMRGMDGFFAARFRRA